MMTIIIIKSYIKPGTLCKPDNRLGLVGEIREKFLIPLRNKVPTAMRVALGDPVRTEKHCTNQISNCNQPVQNHAINFHSRTVDALG